MIKWAACPSTKATRIADFVFSVSSFQSAFRNPQSAIPLARIYLIFLIPVFRRIKIYPGLMPEEKDLRNLAPMARTGRMR
jgi:hypothetical protein